MSVDLLYSTPERARKLEHAGNWEDAAKMWRYMARHRCIDYEYSRIYEEHAEACELIIHSTAIGDEYRRRVLEYAGPEPRVEDPYDSISWRTWYSKMSAIYDQMFRQKH